MRILASVSYDGSKYNGFQRLKNENSVQAELEAVLSKITKSDIVVKGAGRTDRGVHALDQKVHFDIDINIDCDHLKEAMNSMLSDSVYVKKCEVVNKDFHARFNVQKKEYEYIINMGEFDPIINDYVYNYNRKLNVKKMKKAAKYYIGIHNFQAFVSGERENFDSVIYKVDIYEIDNMLHIKFIGKSFYRYMVRNMVGALLMVGQEKCRESAIEEMLFSKRKNYNYLTVPASGLYLNKINY